ncbi:carbohydrate ABC transporter substrate-binding protein [Actinobacteria bacterium YIM 96077]|uniref:Arabinose-binding protein n=1 Tax=Phytoactinopolyspora halophila TaxID=1981511 RepID=A0A329QI36_9ACTN|nr:ABC transporter substrate-binding protein [Phytoactinopolyspora halophila]AYY14075.1 carbohydrate ABC transporter substrate-binding protein [Actinobacteria bacterium YIM 96077]RAW10982.1 arabinose-binding protein [Phytoactinopolyspora halophila]
MLALTRSRRPWLGSVPVFAVLALVAAGCAGEDGNSIAELEEGEDTERQAMEADPEHEGEDVELEFWTFVDAHTDFMMARAEEFNEQNSEYNIILDASTADFEEMHDRLLIALQSGSGAPDIVDIEIQRFATFLRGDVPLHPLTDLVDKHRDQLVEERTAPYQLDGVEYGIDYHLGTWVMYYNNEILEEAGVDVDSIVTWDDYIEAGEQVVENTDAAMTSIETTDRFSVLGLMLQNGGGTYNENNELILDSPENVEALQLISDMVHEHEIAEVAEGGMHHETSYYEALNDGAYASVWMPQWYVTRFKDFMPETEGNMLIRPLPEFESGEFISTMGGGTGTAITTQIDEDKLDAAKQFLEFAKLEYDSQVALWTELGFDPFRTDVYDDPALTEPDPWFGGEPVMTNLRDMFDRLAPEYTGPRYPEAIVQLRETVAYEVVEEGASPEEALRKATEEVEAMD